MNKIAMERDQRGGYALWACGRERKFLSSHLMIEEARREGRRKAGEYGWHFVSMVNDLYPSVKRGTHGPLR